jgi:hypothetical protein
MKGLRLLGGLCALLSLVETVRADIPPPPPPPPTIPGTAVTLPGALSIVLLGCALSLAIMGFGLAILRKRGQTSKPARAWVIVPATLVAIATAGLTVWAALEHSAHAARAASDRANWRPNGPVRPPERSAPVGPAAINPPVEKSQAPNPEPDRTDK